MAKKASVPASPATGDAIVARKTRKKQAVVVIHGMGEQRPMSTLRGFVEAVWARDIGLTRPDNSRMADPDNPLAKEPINKSWITPDPRTGSYEQRRITTPYDVNGRRTDFFELYWADLTQGTSRARLYAWVRSLLLRKPSDIPADAAKLYFVTLLLALVVFLAAIALGFSFWRDWLGWQAVLAVTAVSSIIFWAIDQFVLPYFGDVASYVRAEAGTVEKRALVRERGLGLLRKLLEDEAYDRIVLVSHSLGSMIAYDLLQILWAERRPRNIEWKADRQLFKAIHAVQRFASLPGETLQDLAEKHPGDFRKAQWELYRQLRSPDPRVGKGWKISDFVTLGSPLTHAEFLVTQNLYDWKKGVSERLFALCPPLSDRATKRRLLYEQGRNPQTNAQQHAVHHAAVFAATRWTNVHDKGNGWLTGDPISGPMLENFGPGVEETQVRLKWALGRLFTHTHYWSLDVKGREVLPLPADRSLRGHLEVVRDAVDLSRKLEP